MVHARHWSTLCANHTVALSTVNLDHTGVRSAMVWEGMVAAATDDRPPPAPDRVICVSLSVYLSLSLSLYIYIYTTKFIHLFIYLYGYNFLFIHSFLEAITRPTGRNGLDLERHKL